MGARAGESSERNGAALSCELSWLAVRWRDTTVDHRAPRTTMFATTTFALGSANKLTADSRHAHRSRVTDRTGVSTCTKSTSRVFVLRGGQEAGCAQFDESLRLHGVFRGVFPGVFWRSGAAGRGRVHVGGIGRRRSTGRAQALDRVHRPRARRSDARWSSCWPLLPHPPHPCLLARKALTRSAVQRAVHVYGARLHVLASLGKAHRLYKPRPKVLTSGLLAQGR